MLDALKQTSVGKKVAGGFESLKKGTEKCPIIMSIVLMVLGSAAVFASIHGVPMVDKFFNLNSVQGLTLTAVAGGAVGCAGITLIQALQDRYGEHKILKHVGKVAKIAMEIFGPLLMAAGIAFLIWQGPLNTMFWIGLAAIPLLIPVIGGTTVPLLQRIFDNDRHVFVKETNSTTNPASLPSASGPNAATVRRTASAAQVQQSHSTSSQ